MNYQNKIEKYFLEQVMVSPVHRNRFVGAGHNLTRPYKPISISHRVTSDCVVL